MTTTTGRLNIGFIVPGVPVQWARARVDPRRRTLTRKLSSAAFFTPDKQAKRMELVALAAKSAMRGRDPIKGPVAAEMVFVFPRPRTTRGRKTRPGRQPMIKAPDQANLEKLVEDACNGIVYRDDRQLFCRLGGAKWYASEDEEPHTEVTFVEWT